MVSLSVLFCFFLLKKSGLILKVLRQHCGRPTAAVAVCGSIEVVKRRSPTSQRPLPVSLLLYITRREQIGPTNYIHVGPWSLRTFKKDRSDRGPKWTPTGPTWRAGTWPLLSADRVKMRRAGPRCMTSRINDKRPVSSIIRQFTQNTVKVCFTLKQ